MSNRLNADADYFGLSAYPSLGYVPGQQPVSSTGNTKLDTAKTIFGDIEGLFKGGSAVDAARAARVQYFLNQANQGNVAAAQIIIGAIPNVAGNEDPMWESAIDQLRSSAAGSNVLAAAQALGPYWPVGSSDTAQSYPIMRSFTANWAAHNAPLTAIANTLTGGAVNTLFGGSAPSGASSLLVFGAVGLAAYLYLRKR
jgi:hypothetical protein